LGKAYADGNTAYEADEAAKSEIHEINRQIYEHDPAIEPLWKETRQWSLDYFDMIYKRVGTTFKRFFFESEVADRGLAIAKKAVEDNILVIDDGAIILDGKQHGVDTRVFVNKLGLPTYEGKELGLAELEFTEFGNVDQCIHVVGPEQKSFFQTTFKAEELINPEKFKGKQHHYVYGFVDLKDGKMSSRKGNVLPGVGLLDEVKKNIQEEFKVSEEIADVIAVGAVKYSFLKVEAQKGISFDIKESISVQGNSGPYLQYVYARIQSMVGQEKPGNIDEFASSSSLDLLTPEDILVLRKLAFFDEVVAESANSFSPHILCTYLYQLGQSFNSLYEKRSILKEEQPELKKIRIFIIQRVAETLKNGLELLGIRVLSKI
jgi:arginyl-tRNA synthetase